MPRKRDLKPGFFKNEDLGEMPPVARLFFAGLWCWADREGRLEDRPRKLKADILAYDDCNGDELMDLLIDKGFVIRYEVDGVKYLQINNFKEHQSPHPNEAASTIPSNVTEEQVDCSSVVTEEEGTSNVEPIEEQPTDNVGLTEGQDTCNGNVTEEQVTTNLQVTYKQPSSNLQVSDKQVTTNVVAGDKQRTSNPSLSFTSFSSFKTETKRARDEEIVSDVFSTLQNKFGIINTSYRDIVLDMIDQYPHEWIIKAIDRAVEYKKRRIKYLDAILKGWRDEGYEDWQKPWEDDKHGIGKSGNRGSFRKGKAGTKPSAVDWDAEKRNVL